MDHAMVCRVLAATGLLALTGCAQEGVRPSYLGLSDLAGNNPALQQPAPQTDDVPDILRHVQSNKVLGAMAFQRMTGRTVDPDSLIRSNSE
ncbi:MAG: hypothetical protein JSR78_00550 [Proteobacteria bacterium]|nr:hypothetical protein [Pseudomonadota bacterium]